MIPRTTRYFTKLPIIIANGNKDINVKIYDTHLCIFLLEI